MPRRPKWSVSQFTRTWLKMGWHWIFISEWWVLVSVWRIVCHILFHNVLFCFFLILLFYNKKKEDICWKMVLTIISCKVRAADNTASSWFYHFLFLSLSLNHHNPYYRHLHSFLSLSLSDCLSLHLSLSFLSFFLSPTAHSLFLYFAHSQFCRGRGRTVQCQLMMMMIIPVCLSSLSSLLLAFFSLNLILFGSKLE